MKFVKTAVGMMIIWLCTFNISFVEGQTAHTSANIDNPLDKANEKTSHPSLSSDGSETKKASSESIISKGNENKDKDDKGKDASPPTEDNTTEQDNLAIFSPTPIVTLTPPHEKEIATLEKLVKDWTTAFNKKDLANTCGLFAKNIVADYRGQPPKDHTGICNGFRKIFADKSHRYEYRYKIHNIYRIHDLAVIRITWYLHTFKDGEEISVIQDEGMDVLSKNDKDQWKIINYLAYQK